MLLSPKDRRCGGFRQDPRAAVTVSPLSKKGREEIVATGSDASYGGNRECKALATFEELGAPARAERARAELGRANIGPHPANALTASEQRVAEPAASGMTNRDVAATLFISPKTWRPSSPASTANSTSTHGQSSANA